MSWVIAFIAFACGFIVMALEIAGARLLTTHFGGIITTWASIISVFLTALSVGYYFGGATADRFPSLRGLGILLFLSTLTILLIIPLSRWSFPQAEVTAKEIHAPIFAPENFFERLAGQYGVLFAATVLFFLPSMFLGSASPYLIRISSKTIDTAGRISGGIYAISTVGSIVGTLGCTFVLLPNLGVREVLLFLSVATVFVAFVCFATTTFGQSRKNGKTVLILLIALTVASIAIGRVIYERDSLYHHIVVDEVNHIRYLKFDASYQSGMNLLNPDQPVFIYTDYLHLGVVFKPDAKKILFIGLGGATAPKKFHRDYPYMTVHIAELDSAVKEVAEQFFDFREDERMRVFIGDGRVYLRKTTEVYDLIVLDAYYGNRYGVTLPFHLTTSEFLQLAKSHLSNDGVLAFNLVGRLEGSQSKVTRAILKTYRSVFPEVYIFPVNYRRMPALVNQRNLIVISPKKFLKLTQTDIVKIAQRLVAEGKVKIKQLAEYASDLYTKPIPTNDVPLLTDNYAPIEFLNP